ncbi:MAG: STAS domain-containing protein [SAR324 cluster bacterium]|nr:STAS domain-containing protein [SAR324 cluster bacterium]
MKLSHRTEGNICIISINGDFVGNQAAQLKGYATELLDGGVIKAFIFNLHQTTRIDSSGLGMVIFWIKKTKASEIGFSICQPSELILNDLKSARLHLIIPVYNTEQEALTSINN